MDQRSERRQFGVALGYRAQGADLQLAQAPAQADACVAAASRLATAAQALRMLAEELRTGAADVVLADEDIIEVSASAALHAALSELGVVEEGEDE